MVWYLIIGLLCGLLIAFIAVIFYLKRLKVGQLRVDHSIPEDPPLIFLELVYPVEYVIRKKTVVLKVKRENFISQK